MIKRALRNSMTFIIFSPMILFIHLSSIIIGKERTFRKWGPRNTFMAKKVVGLFVPSIESARDFDHMASKMTSRLWFWKLVWDVDMEVSEDALRLQISNCPVCEVFSAVGLSSLNPYACQGDWDYAAENADKWRFERKHQIGTDDRFCDHTYRRLQ